MIVALTILSTIGGKLWKGFCSFISTPIGAALVAGLLAWNVATIHEYHKVNARWEAKWQAAEVAAEVARKKRDAEIAETVKVDADSRMAVLVMRKTELEEKVKQYENEVDAKPVDPKKPVAASCLTDSSDDQWVRDIQRQRKSKGGSVPAVKLRGTVK